MRPGLDRVPDGPIGSLPASGSQLRQVAYNYVKELIVSNQLEPGSLLTIDELVRRLGVSRTPIREALLRLQDEHFVEIMPQRAIRVTMIAPKEVQELFDVREMLECAAIEHASQAVPRETLDRIDRMLIEAEQQVQEGNYEMYVRSDVELHSQIQLHAGNSLLVHLLNLLHDRARRIRLFVGAYREPRFARAAVLEHRAIVDALRRRDAPAARRLLADHLRGSARRIVAYVHEHPGASTSQPVRRRAPAPSA